MAVIKLEERRRVRLAFMLNGLKGFTPTYDLKSSLSVAGLPVADIISRNYNLDIKNPRVGEQISHDPDELLTNYRTIIAEAASIRERLKQELTAALKRES